MKNLDVKFKIPPSRVLEDYSVPRSTAAKLGTILFILRQENLVKNYERTVNFPV